MRHRLQVGGIGLLFLVQLYCLTIMLGRSSRWLYLLTFGGVALQWLSFCFLQVRDGERAFRFLSRISFAVVLGCAPFTIYTLNRFHACVVSFEDIPWFLVVLLVLIPLFVRFVVCGYFERRVLLQKKRREERAKLPRLRMPSEFRDRIFKEWSPGHVD